MMSVGQMEQEVTVKYPQPHLFQAVQQLNLFATCKKWKTKIHVELKVKEGQLNTVCVFRELGQAQGFHSNNVSDIKSLP